jgi:hypothetical protein
MSKRFLKLALIAASAGVLCGGTALANPIEMFLSSGNQSTQLLIGSNGTPSSVSYVGTLNGWTIKKGTGGTSYAPNQVGLNLKDYVVTCAGTGCSKSSLTVVISATGFTVPINLNQFQLGLSGDVAGGTITSSAYYDTANQYFCGSGDVDDQDHDHGWGDDEHHHHHDHDEGTGSARNQCGASNLIGSLTLSGPSTGITVNGGPDPIRSYSLTVSNTFSFAGAHDPSFQVTSTLTNVPEPGTLALFGAGLLGVVVLARRRRTRQG